MLLRTLNMHCLTSHNYTKVLVPPVTGSNSNLSTPGVVVSSTLITTHKGSCYKPTHKNRTWIWISAAATAWPRDCILLQLPPVCQHQQLKRNSAMACWNAPRNLQDMREREGDQTILLLLHISQLLRLHSILLLRVVGKFPLCPIPTATSNLSSLLCLASQTQKLSTLAATI